ncbi:hypothetical protein FUAX_28040 [Fulvitalea axinellae]|uniref:Uncharacterized protein n=1 Tax=Fulvitalea axinellae TaxID=1182444 RepID=A0AAU9CY27_9BACT|nr:hypothetical protein FUAX_28040 [Fulvitalea axinellae]
MNIRILILALFVAGLYSCSSKEKKKSLPKTNHRVSVNKLAFSPVTIDKQENVNLRIKSGAMAIYTAGTMRNHGMVLSTENGNILFVPIGEKLVNELSPVTIVSFEPNLSIGQNMRGYLYTGFDAEESLPVKLATQITLTDSLCSGRVIAISSKKPADTSVFVFNNMKVFNLGRFASKTEK